MTSQDTRERLRVLPALIVAIATLALGFRFFGFISKYSVNVLFYDQWDFLRLFFRGDPGLSELFFLQHGPPREGLGLIADKFLYSWTHWSVRAESFMIGACIFAALLLALLLKKKLLGALSYSDISFPLIFLTLAQHDTLIGTPNPAYSAIPLLLMMLYCLILLQNNRMLRYSLVLAMNLLLIYTGFGVFMGVVTLGVFGFECWEWKHRTSPASMGLPLGALLLAGASMASFFVHYRFEPASDCFALPSPGAMSYPRFVALMFSTDLGLRGPEWLALVVGAALLFFALAILWIETRRLVLRQRSCRDLSLIVAALTGYVLLFAINTAAGRACLGLPAAAQQSRYTTLMIPAFLAMNFFLLSLPQGSRRNIALWTFVAALIAGSLKPPLHAHDLADGKRAWAACYLRTENIAYCDQATHFLIYPDPARTGLQQKLDYLKQHRLNLFAKAGK